MPSGAKALPAQYSAAAEPPDLPSVARIERAERFFTATGANIRHGYIDLLTSHADCHFPWIVRIEWQDNCGLMRFRIMRISPG
jgi:hypothetical protein